jgi:prevent-host-death family protein
MSDVTATEAARRFSDLLDAVEHDGRRFTIVRHGRVVAHLGPAAAGRGDSAKEVLRLNRPDPEWLSELIELRGQLGVQERS